MSKCKTIYYKWKRAPKGAPSAKVAGNYLASIKRKKGGLTPRSLVIESSKKKSPLHNCFEWDNTKAAYEYRIVQAREILRFLVIEVEVDSESEPVFLRAYISPQELEQEDETTYVSIREVQSNEELSEAYLRQLKRELDAIKAKIKNFKEFAAVVKAIEAVKI